MEHIAIDLGSRESQVCIRDEKGQILSERRVLTRTLRAQLKRRPTSRVVMETCAEAFKVADAAIALGHEVRVVPATLVRALGVGARGIKTDLRDARVLSEVSTRMDLPSVHIPSISSREGKSMCNARSVLVRARTMLVNAERGYLRTHAVKIPSGSTASFPARVGKTLESLSPTKAANADAPADSKRPTPGASPKRKEKTSNAAPTKEPSPPTTRLPPFAERLLTAIQQLTELIEEADAELAARVAPDPVAQRLMTVPGVGAVCATRFVTTIDATERFQTTEQLGSYLGLAPGEHQSGDKQRRTKTIKCGAAETRAALVQSAWSIWRVRKNDPMVRWAQEIEKRRGKQVAITALARKLATVMFVMWRDGTTYEPSHASRKTSERMEASSTT
jgi:transposase